VARGLDHIVHAVHDLDAVAEQYRALGFTVGARNKHPWGTHNYIVQLPGFFIELLTVAEPGKIVPPAARSFTFGDYTQAFLRRQQGFAMLVLESRDAQADAKAFRGAGIGDYDVFDFEREGRRPDGREVKVAFSLAFATAPQADAGFFVCQQHYPENFWNPDFQKHANTACGVAGVVLVAEQPADYDDFVAAFTGADVQADDGRLRVETGRGVIEVITPVAFFDRYGVDPPNTSAGMRIAALRLQVRDLDAARAITGGGKRLNKSAFILPSGSVAGANLILEAG
jgi:hypothetical protein